MEHLWWLLLNVLFLFHLDRKTGLKWVFITSFMTEAVIIQKPVH